MNNNDLINAVSSNLEKVKNENREVLEKLVSNYWYLNNSVPPTEEQMKSGFELVAFTLKLSSIATITALQDLGILNID